MSPDLIDERLDRSAPATRAPREADLAAMIADARAQAPRPRRARRIGLTAASLAAILLGGTGVAAATDGFSWAPWAQDPVGAVSFTMVNGFECELRFSRFSGGVDPAFIAQVNHLLEEWHRSTDVVGEAEALLPQQRQRVASTMLESGMDAGSDTSVLSPEEQAIEAEHREWSREWLAWELTVSELESEELQRHGIEPGDDRFVGSERSGQIQCNDGAGQPYVPGSGS